MIQHQVCGHQRAKVSGIHSLQPSLRHRTQADMRIRNLALCVANFTNIPTEGLLLFLPLLCLSCSFVGVIRPWKADCANDIQQGTGTVNCSQNQQYQWQQKEYVVQQNQKIVHCRDMNIVPSQTRYLTRVPQTARPPGILDLPGAVACHQQENYDGC